MDISVFGLGYVGAVISACFARNGHRVLGVDTNPDKVGLLRQGRSPIIEPKLEPMIANAVAAGRLEALTDAAEAIRRSSISMICVGTPSQADGGLDLTFVRRVCADIGTALRSKSERHVIVVRSTMLPGSVEGVAVPALEAASGKHAGADFGVAFNPEFLRESSAVDDFYAPPKTVIGEMDSRDGDAVAALYAELSAPLFRTSIRVAEMVKYCDNVFHALKIVFGNEIGIICKAMGIDSHEVMEVFCADRKLNLSPVYLKPGFAFGGSCLPKDLRALTWLADSERLDVPVLKAIGLSNDAHIERTCQRLLATGKRRIGILGLAFKAGTDDLRESPLVSLVTRLRQAGCELRLYDRQVSQARLVGANRSFIEERIPDVAELLCDSPAEVMDHGEVIVVGNGSDEFAKLIAAAPPGQLIVDLVRICGPEQRPHDYEGVAW